MPLDSPPAQSLAEGREDLECDAEDLEDNEGKGEGLDDAPKRHKTLDEVEAGNNKEADEDGGFEEGGDGGEGDGEPLGEAGGGHKVLDGAGGILEKLLHLSQPRPAPNILK